MEHQIMKERREPKKPLPRSDTLRHQIMAVLQERTASAKDLSAAVRASEKEVYSHLDHIRRSLARGPLTFVMRPPECRKCGFVFTRMARLRKPGKCPACRSESIREPLFSIGRERRENE